MSDQEKKMPQNLSLPEVKTFEDIYVRSGTLFQQSSDSEFLHLTAKMLHLHHNTWSRTAYSVTGQSSMLKISYI